jgi:hypothetical protein
MLDRATRNLRGTSVACVALACQFARMSCTCHASITAHVHHPDNILCKCNENLLLLRLNDLLYNYTTISLCIYSQKIAFEWRSEFISFSAEF